MQGHGANEVRELQNCELETETKKRPDVNQDAPGSPPPELPNHDWIVRRERGSVNVTFVILIIDE
jgi:hypothetical protein